ncbi:MAG TPA: type II toxin-antitoxin system RelE/ParE family toxin [Bacteroidales bacterium]|nr:type II toxin-antitoxin system RelE/ParE family toxin [Bacteroidales bacterium]
MARIKIAWSIEAKQDLVDILQFYNDRNGNPAYSKKLFVKINRNIRLLAKNPFLGIRTDDPDIRALITGDYQIIYEVFERLVLVLMIWDNRKDPDDKIIDTRRK